MDLEHRSFLAGVVLGAGVALLAGHAFLWAPVTVLREGTQPSGTMALSDLEQQPETSGFSQLLEPLPTEPVGLDSIPTEQPIRIALAIADTPGHVQLPATAEAAQPEVPELAELPDRPLRIHEEPAPLIVPDASPLPVADDSDASHESGPAGAAELRALIDRELADRPPSEREVWFESLQDLSLPHAAGVLEMWKQSERPNGLLPFQVAPLKENPPLVQRLPDQSRTIHLDNLRLATLPGFLRRIPGECGPGPHALRTRIDFRPGQRIETGGCLDCAISGPGFLQVTDGNRSYLTRCGTMTLDDSRRLVLNTQSRELRLVPEIKIPENAVSIQGQPNGQIVVAVHDAQPLTLGPVQIWQIPNPSGLEPQSPVLFALTETAGKPQPLQAEDVTAFEWECLEVSNVDPEAELHSLKLLDLLGSQR